MPTSLDDLISPENEDESLSYYLTELANVGFPTTAWQTGSVAYTIIRILAKKTVDLVALVSAVAKGGLLDLATGSWLTLLATSFYQINRYAATFSKGKIRLSITVGNPGQTIQPGQIWVKTSIGNKRFNSINVSPVTITSGGSVVVDFKAESPGTSYNVAISTGLLLVTPLPGLIAEFESVGDGTWLTVQGADEEKDPEVRTRCRSRWATIGIEKIKDAYVHLATNTPGLGTQPDRVMIDDQNPRGPNTIDIWLAGPSGPLPSSDVLLIRDYVIARKSPCSDIEVNAAIPRNVVVNANVFYSGEFKNAVAESVDNLRALIQSLPLGGKLLLAQTIEEIMSPVGVVNETALLINAAAADLQLAANEVAVVDALNLVGIVQNS